MKRHKTVQKDRRKKKTNLGKVFDRHVKFEFEDKDVESTMKTMIKEPYVHHVPVMTGGMGRNAVYEQK